MAFQVIQLPSYTQPNSGYSTLGNVLLGASSDYLKHTRDTQLEDKLRAQHLADVESERTNEAAVHARNRGETLTDNRLAKEVGMRAELIRLGFLSSDKLYAEANDPAVLAAAQEFGKTALAKTYIEAVNSGFLSYSDFGDKNKVDAGLAQWSKHQQQQTDFATKNKANAAEGATQNAQERVRVQQKLDALETKIAAQMPPLSDNELLNRARQIYSATHGGDVAPTTPQKLASEIEQARTELTEQRKLQFLQENQDDRRQYELLHGQLQSIDANTRTFASSGVFGAAPPIPTTSMALPGNALAPANPAQIAAALRTAAPPVAAPPSPAPSSLADPYARIKAMDIQQKQQAAGDASATLAEPYNNALDELAQIDKDLQFVKEGYNPDAATPDTASFGFGKLGGDIGAPPSITLSPEEQNQRIQQLQAKKDALLQQVQQTRRTMLNLSPQSAVPPTATPGTPFQITPRTEPSPFSAPGSLPVDNPAWWGSIGGGA